MHEQATAPATDETTDDALPLAREVTRLLIVDDDRMVRDACARLLRGVADLDVRTAATVGEALAIVEEWQPRYVLSDCDLGEQRDGFDLARELRESTAYVVLMSGLVDTFKRDRAKWAGAVGIVQKPVNVKALVECLLGRE